MPYFCDFGHISELFGAVHTEPKTYPDKIQYMYLLLYRTLFPTWGPEGVRRE